MGLEPSHFNFLLKLLPAFVRTLGPTATGTVLKTGRPFGLQICRN